MDCEVSRFAVCVPFREPFRGLCSVSVDKRFVEGYFCTVFTRGLGGGQGSEGAGGSEARRPTRGWLKAPKGGRKTSLPKHRATLSLTEGRHVIIHFIVNHEPRGGWLAGAMRTATCRQRQRLPVPYPSPAWTLPKS